MLLNPTVALDKAISCDEIVEMFNCVLEATTSYRWKENLDILYWYYTTGQYFRAFDEDICCVGSADIEAMLISLIEAFDRFYSSDLFVDLDDTARWERLCLYSRNLVLEQITIYM